MENSYKPMDLLKWAALQVNNMSYSSIDDYLTACRNFDTLPKEIKERADILANDVVNSEAYCNLLNIPYDSVTNRDLDTAKVFSLLISQVDPNFILPIIDY